MMSTRNYLRYIYQKPEVQKTIIVLEQETQNLEHHLNPNSSIQYQRLIKGSAVDLYQLRVILRSNPYKEGINNSIL